MPIEFKAEADAHGGRVDLTWTWTAPGDRPQLRLLRRRRACPTGPEDGLCVLDLADHFWMPDQTYARVERTFYLGRGTTAENRLRHAEMHLHFAAPDASQPSLVVVAHYDPIADATVTTRIEEISRLERSQIATPPWTSVEIVEIFATPGGGPEELAGRIVVSTGHEDGTTPDRFDWTASGDPPVSVAFDRTVAQETRVILDEVFDLDSGDWKRRMTVEDGGLDPETVYYYTIYAPDPATPGVFLSKRAWRASAMATGRYGLDERLYQLLPALHKQYDEPSPDSQGRGQLRSYLQVFGLGLDQVRSLAEGLRGRHDVQEVRADLLPHLARWIGWELDRTADELAQRNDVLFAPEIYSTVGTVPNVRALVNRITGWNCRVKEFVHNVFLTNATETIYLWEIWERRHDGTDWSDPAPITRIEEGFEGRPAAAVDGGGVGWLFWHSDRSGRREIWLQRLDGVDPVPRRAALDAPDDDLESVCTDEYPATVADGARVWLCWNSNREGSWDIWVRPYDGLPGGESVRLTEHSAADRHPAVVRDGPGQIRVFWQSNRRGPTDIWTQVYDGAGLNLPERVTTAQFRHEMPAAVVDGSGQTWLFYVADFGTHRNIHVQVHDGSDWGEPEPVTEGLQRDESPAAVFWGGQVWLFWHSNRDGPWQIWGRVHDGVTWGDPFPVTAHATADKEPAAVVDGGGGLRVFWRSQRRANLYKSRTIDVNDVEMLARLGTFDDRAHYTYDTGLGEKDWYARGTVGLYLAPDTEDPDLVTQQLDRAQGFVEPFRPLPVRFVWLTEPIVIEEVINTDGLIGEEFFDEVA